MPVQHFENIYLLAAVPLEQAATVFLISTGATYGVWRALRGDIARKEAENLRAWEAVRTSNDAAQGLIQSTDKVVSLLAATTSEHRLRLEHVIAESRAIRSELKRVQDLLDELRGHRVAG